MKKDSINKCQYWNTYEPLQCIYWDNANTVCTYVNTAKENTGSFVGEDGTTTTVVVDNPKHATCAPYCNLIGTSLFCNHYKSPSPGTRQARCILPDSARHVCNRATGDKWVLPNGKVSAADDEELPEISAYYEIQAWDFDAINGYNSGQCDGSGTDTTCSGYSPYHLGFGILQPSSEEGKYDLFKENKRLSTTEEFGYRLPTNFVIYNIRATLSKCYHWDGGPGTFSVTSEGKIELSDSWQCSMSKDTSKYSEFNLESGPPCNGCKPECPHYTGVCWQYCVDEKMESGDPILAEQIHELRYYHRENMWTTEDMESSFIDGGTIFAWAGAKNTGKCSEGEDGCVPSNNSTITGNMKVTASSDDGLIFDYEIPVVKTWMGTFESFDVNIKHELITKGTSVTKDLTTYPTLIGEIQELPLSPIIKNKFARAKDGGYSSDTYLNDTYYFETASLARNQNLLIYGKVFDAATTKAINISDKELYSVLPIDLYKYQNTYELKRAYLDLSAGSYDKFITDLRASLSAIETFLSDKVGVNLLPTKDYTFLMEAPTVSSYNSLDGTNENTVLVYQDLGDDIVFSKTTFTKRVVGGVLSQTTFTLTGDDLATDTPYNYEKDFAADSNENGSITFEFIPFESGGIASEPGRIFNDSMYISPSSSTVHSGFNFYKLTATEFPIEEENFCIIGSSGYALIDIDDEYLNNLFGPFEVEEIVVTYTLDNPDYTGGEDQQAKITKECEMEVVCHGASGLIGPQQLIVRPKNSEDLSAACDAYVELRNLVYFDKVSYEEGVPATEFFYSELVYSAAQMAVTLNIAEMSFSENICTISNFKGFTMTPTVIINNCEGKPFTQYKTKPVGMVHQPFCQDVEIYYAWSADYIKYLNQPSCLCAGQPWEEVNPEVCSKGFGAPCGDHFASDTGSAGPMWWPYNACREWLTYEQLTNLSNWSVDVMGLYQLKYTDENGSEQWLHGSHDMRMQGPHNNYGEPGPSCNPINACSCLTMSYNYRKTSDNIFGGWCKIRVGVSSLMVAEWKRNGSTLPKFGNPSRPFLRSYRTLDRLLYYDSGGSLALKLMPASMVFSKLDITAAEDEMWSWYCSIHGPNVINPLGFLLATRFDGVDLLETFDSINRFKHDDVFRCKSTSDIAYQETTGDYVHMKGDVRIIPWYEFKEYKPPQGTSSEEGGSSEDSIGSGSYDYIQWAWQEPWLPLERNYKKSEKELASFILGYKSGVKTSYVKGPFINIDGSIVGLFRALIVDYPKYCYDFKNKEYCQMIDEGECILSFIAPKKEESSGEYIGYPAFQLGTGPKRGINWQGEWLTENNKDGVEDSEAGAGLAEDYNFELYDKCIGDTYKYREVIDYNTHEFVWSDDVTLFGEGYTSTSVSTAEASGRMYETYYKEPDGSKVIYLQTCFQRGLNITINMSATTAWPLQLAAISQFKAYGYGQDVGDFIAVCGTATYCVGGFAFDNVKRTLGRFKFSYKFGSEQVSESGLDIATEDVLDKAPIYKYYHKPQILIYSADANLNPVRFLYASDEMEIYSGADNNFETLTEVCEWENAWDYIVNGEVGIFIAYRLTPTSSEISDLDDGIKARYEKSNNLISVTGVSLYEEYLTNAQENLNLHERKYYVSHASTDAMPPQGDDDDEDKRVLRKLSNGDKSTVWQEDYLDGVYDVPNSSDKMTFMNKVRGRLLDELGEDGEVVNDDIYVLEQLQKKFYDAVCDKIEQDSVMVGFLPEPTKTLLKEAGVNFSGYLDLKLHNSTVAKLATLEAKPQMSAEGHRYQPGPPTEDIWCGNAYYLFEYANQDEYLEDDILVNAVVLSQNLDGTYDFDPDGAIVGVTTSDYFVSWDASSYGMTGENLWGNAFDTVSTNPIVQLYRGAAWQMERVKLYETLMSDYFPDLFDRGANTNALFSDSEMTSIEFTTIGCTGSLSTVVSSDFEPGLGLDWNSVGLWKSWFFGPV